MKASTIFSIVLTLCLISFTSCAGEYMRISGFTQNGIQYAIIDEHTVSVSGSTSGDAEDILIIPAKVEHLSTTYTVTGIKRLAFYGCTWLQTIHLPKTLEFIESGAFAGCENMVHITLEAALPPVFKGKAFDDSVQEKAILAVPYSVVYMKDEDWSKFRHIVDLQ